MADTDETPLGDDGVGDGAAESGESNAEEHVVRQWREAIGLTIEELATSADVSRGTIINAENGGALRPTNLRAIAIGLGIGEENWRWLQTLTQRRPCDCTDEEVRRIVRRAIRLCRRQQAGLRQSASCIGSLAFLALSCFSYSREYPAIAAVLALVAALLAGFGAFAVKGGSKTLVLALKLFLVGSAGATVFSGGVAIKHRIDARKVPVVAPVLPPEVPKVDHDRIAAEFVLSKGGIVQVNGKGVDIKTPEELAKIPAPYALTWIDLHAKGITDRDLPPFENCKGLKHINLDDNPVTDAGMAYFKDCKELLNLALYASAINVNNGTAVSDVGLAYFKDCKNLKNVQLGATRVTDDGLKQFADCKDLEVVSLMDTKITDAGIAHLEGCKKLKKITLVKTRVTRAGIDKLQKALPDCKIEWDGTPKNPK